jgi:hypothetical protein
MDKDRVIKAALKRQQEVAGLCIQLECMAGAMRKDRMTGAAGLLMDAVSQLRNLTGLDQVSPTGGSDAVPSLAESVPPRNPQLPD